MYGFGLFGGVKLISLELIQKLNVHKARYPSSTERVDSTEAHNASPAVGGAPHSWHLTGQAVDLVYDDSTLLEGAAKFAITLGFGGIELDLRNNHLHLDMRPLENLWHVVYLKDGTKLALADYLTTQN